MTVIAHPSSGPTLKSLGFQPVGAAKRRMFISTEGGWATGKTHFLRTCPPPIVVIDLDRGMEGVAETDIWGGIIQHKVFDMPSLDEFSKSTSPIQRELAKDTYARLKATVEGVFKSGEARTLGIETGSAAYALAQIARFGQIAQVGEVPPAMWTSMQAEFEGIFNKYTEYNCNLIMSHRQGSKFMGAKGEMELKGYKQMQFIAQVHLEFLKRPIIATEGPAKGKVIDFEFIRRIVKCRQRVALESPSHPQHEFPVYFTDVEKMQSIGGDFITVATAVFPNTTEKDWL